MTHYLRFDSEEQAKTFLAEHVSEDGEWLVASHAHALDPVGVIVKDEVALDGWHLNYVGSKDVSAYEVFPVTPSRVFA